MFTRLLITIQMQHTQSIKCEAQCLYTHKHLLLTGSSLGQVRLFDLKSPDKKGTLVWEGDQEIAHIARDFEGNFVFAHGGQVLGLDLRRPMEATSLGASEYDDVACISVHNEEIVFGDDEGYVYKGVDGSRSEERGKHESGVMGVQHVPGGRSVSAGFMDSSLSVWDLGECKYSTHVPVMSKEASNLMVNPPYIYSLASTGTDVFVGVGDGSIAHYSMQKSCKLGFNSRWRAHGVAVGCMVASPSLLVSAANDRKLRVWKPNVVDESSLEGLNRTQKKKFTRGVREGVTRLMASHSLLGKPNCVSMHESICVADTSQEVNCFVWRG